MKTFGQIVLIIAMLIGTTILSGWVFAKLWFWFLVPTLQAPPLRIVEAIGIMLIIRMLTYKSIRKQAIDTEVFESILISAIESTVFTMLVLLFGQIIVLFM